MKALREAIGLTQNDLAGKAKVTQAWVSRVEAVESTGSKFYTANAIAQALGVPVNEILTEPLTPSDRPGEINDPLLIQCWHYIKGMSQPKQTLIANYLWPIIQTMDRYQVENIP